MKVLFDNNVPAPLRNRLAGQRVDTAQEMGWQELKNGALLAAAEADGFQVLVTGDKNLSYQQNLEGRTLAIVVLGTTRWKTPRQDTSLIAKAVNRVTPGSFETLPAPRLPRNLPRA